MARSCRTRGHRSASGACRSSRALSPNSCHRYPVSSRRRVRPAHRLRTRRPLRAASRCDAPGACHPVISPSTTRAGRRADEHQVRPAGAAEQPAVARRAATRARESRWCPPRPRGRPDRAGRRSRGGPSRSGTSYRSELGGSPVSGDDTPVCRVIGAIPTPATTRSVTSRVGERPCRARHLGAARGAARRPSGSTSSDHRPCR